MQKLSSLEQRVHAKNYLNAERLELLKRIENDYKSMDGAKVQLSTGERSKKWILKGDHKSTNKIINGEKVYLSYQYYFTFSHSFVILHHKVCINGGSYDVRPSTAFCQYVESSDYIGRLDNQYLKDVEDINGSIENATAEVKNPIDINEFNKQKQDYTEALKKVQQIKDNVHYSLRDFLPKYA